MPSVTGLYSPTTARLSRLTRRRALLLPATIPSAGSTAFQRSLPTCRHWKRAATGNGFLNQYTDWDHVVRRVPLILKLGDKPYPSLAAEALRLAFGGHGYVGRAAGANGEKNFGEKTGLTAIRIGPLTVPTDAAGRVWLYYAPPRTDRFVSRPTFSQGISILRSLPTTSR